jgi:hypothetical protein
MLGFERRSFSSTGPAKNLASPQPIVLLCLFDVLPRDDPTDEIFVVSGNDHHW